MNVSPDDRVASLLSLSRRGRVAPFLAMDVMKAANARAAAGKPVFHLEIGQPSAPTPRRVIAAAETALRAGKVGYTEALGVPALREGLAAWYRDYYGVSVPAERIVITTGSSGAFLLAFIAAMDAGQRLGLAEPGYPAYRNILTALDIEPVGIPVGAESHYQPSLDMVRALPKLSALLIASPSNPCGSILEWEMQKNLVEHCAAQGIRLIADEIYHGLTYGARARTVLELTDQAFVINSFSKYFCMTGWRIGWMVVPPDMVRAMECLAQNLFICPPAPSQYAALVALDCRDELDRVVDTYRAGRDILLNELPRTGFQSFAPADGAFYLYADISDRTNDSVAFCADLLDRTGVAITPGVDFDPRRGWGTARFSYAAGPKIMAAAARALARM